MTGTLNMIWREVVDLHVGDYPARYLYTEWLNMKKLSVKVHQPNSER